MTSLLVFALCFCWEAGAVWYTRLAAHSARDARGYASVGVMGAVMAAVGLWGMRLAVPDDSWYTAVAWVAGTGLGAVAGLWLSGKRG